MQLVVDDLTAVYRDKIFAVFHVSFACADDEIIGITGPSGAGKSTFGRCIAGLQKFKSGKIFADELSLNLNNKESTRRYRQTIQFVFQDPLATLPPHLSLGVPIMDAAKITYRNSLERQNAISEILSEMKLDKRILKSTPLEVSGGQRQRIALARALIVKPRFIILDEAVSALDPINRKRILDLLLHYREKHGLGIILISHNIELLTNFCTRIVIYHRSKIVEDTNPKILLSGKGKEQITREILKVCQR